MILEEDSPGKLLQFVFLDPRRGYALLDRASERNRYELYESLTGGGSWSIQSKTSQPPPLPASNTDPEDWRVQAAAKMYSIERRQGESWSHVATVPIAAGQCKPEPVAEPAPPPTQTEAAPKPEKDYVEELHLGGPPAPPKPKKKRKT